MIVGNLEDMMNDALKVSDVQNSAGRNQLTCFGGKMMK